MLFLSDDQNELEEESVDETSPEELKNALKKVIRNFILLLC